MVATAKQVPLNADTTGWLTREQASDMLGVSVSTIAGWARTGLIAEEKGRRGYSTRLVALYNPDDLVRMPRRVKHLPANEAGELNARVVELLSEGATVAQCVVATRETIEKISAIREAWLDTGGADLVITRAAKTELERHFGPFATVAELVAIIATRLGPAYDPDADADADATVLP